MKRKLFTAFCGLLLFSVAFSQITDKAKLDEYFNVLEKNNKFMGSVSVSKNGITLYQRSIGFADVEGNKKADEASKYRIGSITKTFTAVLVMKATEKNLIRLDQTIESFFPSIKNASAITIRHLLSHRSGIHNITNEKDYLTWNTLPQSEQMMMERLNRLNSDFAPDSKFRYSNSNYILLTFLLEKVFKESYPALVKKHIIDPIGLKNTYYGATIQVSKNECQSYTYKNGWKKESETDMSILQGAGALVASASDLNQFSEALFNGKLLQPQSIAEMTQWKDNVGLGLFIIPFYNKKGYGHTGGIDGFSSVFSYFPQDKIAYSLVSNGTNYTINNISIAILSAVFDKPYDIPSFTAFEVSPEELDQYVGSYSTTSLPVKISVRREGKLLLAQVTGQPSFPLEPTAKHKFEFNQAGVKMEFDPEKKSMILLQGAGKYSFTKE
ncbi:MAG: beta-lactamase family protein [Chitinophagaceae bacterium]|nr:beta-lactamase family protein [Chitinophagaceae bacterium]